MAFVCKFVILVGNISVFLMCVNELLPYGHFGRFRLCCGNKYSVLEEVLKEIMFRWQP